jgi:hypothetical protein
VPALEPQDLAVPAAVLEGEALGVVVGVEVEAEAVVVVVVAAGAVEFPPPISHRPG